MTFGRRESAEELTQRVRVQRTQVPYLLREPRFRFFVPVERAPQVKACERLAREMAAQSYGKWELVFIPASEKVAKPLARHLRRREDERLSVANNYAAEEADYVGSLAPETTVSPVMLFLLAGRANGLAEGTAHVLYWNAAGLSPAGRKIEWRVRRPGFSPFALQHGNYLGYDWVVSAHALTEGFAQTHQFLKILTATDAAWHLEPTFLTYHRGLPPAPTVCDVVVSAASKKKRALTAIICFRDKSDWTVKSVKACVAATKGVALDFLLIDNQSRPEERQAVEKALRGVNVRFVNYDRPFNFAAMHNWAMREMVANENVLLLNNDVFWQSGELATLLDVLAQKEVATVGIPLRFPDGKPQHLGFKVSRATPPRQFRVEPLQEDGPLGSWSREVFANTFAACFVKRSIFLKVGGLPELEMANGFGDVAFGLECVAKGYRNLFYAAAWAIHLESGSRGRNYEYWEEAALQRRYPELLQRMADEEFSIDFPGRLQWISPLLGGVKEALRERGGAWEPVRAMLKGWIQTLRTAR